jgi:SAM-dependent methyltransferase
MPAGPDRQLPSGDTAIDYAARVASEKEIYRDCLDVHDLPAILHYWSNRHVRPKLEAFGFSTPDEMFRKYAARQFHNGGAKPRRLASIGAGNCQLEVALASHLLDTGCAEFTIDCLELNPDMLERGRSAAASAGVAPRMNFVPVDLNAWRAAHEYDVIIANQTLHHVLNLENLFAEIKRSLKPGGSFIVSDMIGRNGHQRWPEALGLVREFWRKLPPSYRFNQTLHRYEETYEDWDCSGESFEGVRAQDILPLLIERFHFELFIAFANIIDPFVDRAFGSNFDPAASWDRNFIDQVNECDEKEIASGRIKPTHILAVMGNDTGVPTLFRDSLSPEFCLRDPARVAVGVQAAPAGERSAYEWDAWPHSDRRELQFACQKLKAAQDRTNEQTSLVTKRTQWAQRLDREIESARRRIEELDCELEERAEWAFRLDRELAALHQQIKERTAWALSLDRELAELHQQMKERTAWALRLDQELEEHAARIRRLDQELNARALAHGRDLERLAWALALDRWFHTPLDRGFRLVRYAVRGLRQILSGRSHFCISL